MTKPAVTIKSSKSDDSSIINNIESILGLSVQPIVWISLYFVLTTGSGLPSGPYGIIGAIEGISYLLVLYFSFKRITSSSTKTTKIAVSEPITIQPN